MNRKTILLMLFAAIAVRGWADSTFGQTQNGPSSPSSQETTTVPFSSDRWQIKDPKARVEDHLGRESLYLTSGFAFLKDVELENGVIEVDMAAPNLRSFIGVVFRFENEADHEIVYFRPHKSGLEDAVQYTPSFNGAAPWQLYSGQGFTTAVEFPTQQWVHARIEISGTGGRVYFNNSTKPVLVIEDLKRGFSRGSAGVWGFANGGHFSNFSYRIDPVGGRPEKQTAGFGAGVVSKWELSDAFEVDKRDPEVFPSTADMKSMKWQAVAAETPGMLVIDRYRKGSGVIQFFAAPGSRVGKRPGRKGVFARTTIYSDRDQVKKMSLGYSDEVTVFLNSQPVFTGRSAFRFRDPGFLGIMDVENDSVYLNLRKGKNEIVLGLAEYFGGWGFICRLDDMQGIRFE
jgi:hypothetical protein